MTTNAALSSFAARLFEFIRAQAKGLCPDESVFARFALELFELQYRANAVYRRFCETRGVIPRSIADWRSIPAVPTRAFKEFELTSIPLEARTRVFLSSGTTAQARSQHFHSADSLRLYEKSLLAGFGAHLLTDELGSERLSLVVLTPSAEGASNSSLVHMFQTIGRSFHFASLHFVGGLDAAGGWRVDLPRAANLFRRAVEDGQPMLVVGTAFSFVHLLDFLRENGLRLHLPEGSRVMETGGYKGRSRVVAKGDLAALMVDMLGIPPSHLVSEYGMSELSSQAYDRICGVRSGQRGARSAERVQSAFRFPPWARAVVVSPETGTEVVDGEVGLVRVLDLANVYSVLSVQTEDVAARRGDDFEILGRAFEAEARGCSLMAQQ